MENISKVKHIKIAYESDVNIACVCKCKRFSPKTENNKHRKFRLQPKWNVRERERESERMSFSLTFLNKQNSVYKYKHYDRIGCECAWMPPLHSVECVLSGNSVDNPSMFWCCCCCCCCRCRFHYSMKLWNISNEIHCSISLITNFCWENLHFRG